MSQLNFHIILEFPKSLGLLWASKVAKNQPCRPRSGARLAARLGYGEAEVQGVLGWIQDLAPMCSLDPLSDPGLFGDGKIPG